MPDWDKKYREGGALFGDAPNEYVRQIKGRSDFDAKSALCLADGDGRNSVWLASSGLAVTAVDFSEVALDMARTRDNNAGVEVERILGDLETWSVPNGRAWDAVFILYLQSDPRTRMRAIQVGCEALLPGGWIVLEGFSKKGAGSETLGPDDRDVLYDLDEILEAAAGVEVIEALQGRTLLSEGDKHRGEAEIIRFAARKKQAIPLE